MSKFYFTFGQSHAHRVRGKTFDCDSVCGIEAESYGEARDKMFENFGPKWCFQYEHEPDMSYFPRGVIDL